MRVAAALALAGCLFLAAGSQAQIYDHSARARSSSGRNADKPAGKNGVKPFATLTKDKVAIKGLFTFYRDTTDNSMLMAIAPEQFDKFYLCGETRLQGDGSFYDNSAMLGEFPFYFHRVGNTVMMVEKNVRLRADSTSPVFEAVQKGKSDALVGSTEVKSLPQDSSKAILVDPAEFFIQDANNLNYFLGQQQRTGISFDRKNSYFDEVKSFPLNCEISVKLHYRTGQPQSGATLQNPYSFFHTFHYSLSTIPESDYRPRLADDRVGFFNTIYEDYTKVDQETAYVRYINRWNLKKKNPEARISEPVEPIVYWVDKNTPEEFRDAIAEGIEFWNKAFERIGYRNAVVARQMPDTASWDPADVRYNCIMWMVQPGGGYAVGPSRVNPFTGQIYDADVRVSADFIRYMFVNSENWIGPLQPDGMMPDGSDPLVPKSGLETGDGHSGPHTCTYQRDGAVQAAFGLDYLLSTGVFADKDSVTREYVHAYLVELVAHEVGHTLGLRHNFKSSTIYTLDQLSDRDFTREHGTTGSIMDYTPPNLASGNRPQGEFYASVPGPYDYHAIEYGYADFGAASTEEEREALDKLASKGASDYRLIYATDEDAFGSSMKSVDPYTNLHDLGADPLEFAKVQAEATRKIWYEAIKEFEKPGARWQKLHSVFNTSLRGFANATRLAPKYIGGLDVRRSHIGDPEARAPFKPIDAAKQREAMQILTKYVFAADAFELPAQLVNKLQSEDMEDFSFSAYSGRGTVDYPLHQIALNLQTNALNNLYSNYVLGRLLNNLERVEEGEAKYTMFDMFTDVRRAIWGEMIELGNVNSFRRQLQLAHLGRISHIYVSATSVYPADARTLAANDLEILENAARRAAQSNAIDEMSRAHFKEVLRQIEATKEARRLYLSL